MKYKVNTAIKVNYTALHHTASLIDLAMKVYDEAGVLFGTVTLTEIVGSGGVYYGSFTPDAIGQWRIRIQSVTNLDDVQKVFEISTSDIDEVKLQTQSIEDKIDTIDGNVSQALLDIDAVKDVVDSIEGKVDTIQGKTDNLPVDTATQLNTIESKIDAIDLQIDKGGYIL